MEKFVYIIIWALIIGFSCYKLKKNMILYLSLSVGLTLISYFVFGFSYWEVILIPVLTKASLTDITTRLVERDTYVEIFALAVIKNIIENRIMAGLVWGSVAFVIFIILAALNALPLAGGDMKVIALLSFYLNNIMLIMILLIGLLLSVLCSLIYRYIKQRGKLESIPFIPYLSAGYLTTTILTKTLLK